MFSVRYGPLTSSAGETVPESWYVCAPHPEGGFLTMSGFGRKVDAEIAAKVLPKYGVDWSLPRAELEKLVDEEAVGQFVCAHLQW